jgi:putative CocE/NonD family hydrolase
LYSGHRADACRTSLTACTEFSRVVQPVDGDSELRQLQAAVAERAKLDEHSLDKVVYRDDPVGDRTFANSSAIAHVEAIRRAALPVRIGASWLDGTTAASALERFALLPDVPMQVVISSATHPGGLDADPFSAAAFELARPDATAQFSADVEFVQRVLSGTRIERSVDYVVLGAGVWKNTTQWPPADVRQELLQLSATGLSKGGSRDKTGEISYTLDPATSSGPLNRWSGQLGNPIHYGDRRNAPGRLLSFDATPVSQDMELVGTAELCLVFRSNKKDGLVAAYLEDVAPDGRVTYLTEGVLRLLHRQTQGSSCDPAPGTRRSFKRADGAPVTPGELMHVELPLLPTAALIRKGHRLRLSLAGADAGTFDALTGEAAATWNVAYGSADASRVILPLRRWSTR